MSLTTEHLVDIRAAVARYIATNRSVGDVSREWKEDLFQESVLVLLEGYGGVKIAGSKYFAVQMAAKRLGYSSAAVESTDYDFSADNPLDSIRGNTGQNHEQEVEIQDWMDTKLTGYQRSIVDGLLAGESQERIAESLGVSQSTIAIRIKEIRVEAQKAGYNVN